MVAVFSSFMFTRSFEITQMGFMLGLAVLIDATVVRLLLVPSLMRLAGSWNRWRPGWTSRFLTEGPRPRGGGSGSPWTRRTDDRARRFRDGDQITIAETARETVRSPD